MGDYQFPNNKPSRASRQKRRDKRLHEEVIECRRWGGGDSNKKYRTKGRTRRQQRERLSGDMPFRVSIGEKHKATSFDDNLEPLLRFLQQSVGRHWDDVYSELSQQLDRSTVTGLHVFQHLEHYISTSPQEDFNPKNYTSRKTGVGRWFRIHPNTGILLTGKNGNDHNGPFPKKARFKKEKEKRKSKLRLGLPLEKPAKPALLQPQTLLRHILKNELTDSRKQPDWHLLANTSFDLSDGVHRLILGIESIRFGFTKPGYRTLHPRPNVAIMFKVSSQTFGQISPALRFYESEWETTGENGLAVKELSFKKLDT